MASAEHCLADKAEAVASYAKRGRAGQSRPSRCRPIPARWRAAAKITAALIIIANAPPTILRANCLRVICFAMTLSSAPEVIATVAQWFPSVEVNARHCATTRARCRRPWMTLNRVSGRKVVQESAIILFYERGAAFQALRFGDRRLIALDSEMLRPALGTLGCVIIPRFPEFRRNEAEKYAIARTVCSRTNTAPHQSRRDRLPTERGPVRKGPPALGPSGAEEEAYAPYQAPVNLTW
jgi:hypothetical protein